MTYKRISTLMREHGFDLDEAIKKKMAPKPPKDDGEEDPRKLLADKKGKPEKVSGEQDPVQLGPQLQEEADDLQESGQYAIGSHKDLADHFHKSLRKLGVEPTKLHHTVYNKLWDMHRDFGHRGVKHLINMMRRQAQARDLKEARHSPEVHARIKELRGFQPDALGKMHQTAVRKGDEVSKAAISHLLKGTGYKPSITEAKKQTMFRVRVTHTQPHDGKPGKDGKRAPEPKKKTTVVSTTSWTAEGARSRVHKHFSELGQVVHSVEPIVLPKPKKNK